MPWMLCVASTLEMTLPTPSVQMPLTVQYCTVKSVIVTYEPPTSRQSPVTSGLLPESYAAIVIGALAVPDLQIATLPENDAPRCRSTWSPGASGRFDARPSVWIGALGEVPLFESEPVGET